MTITGKPKAAHKLDLRDGDVVELMAWQRVATNQKLFVGTKWLVGGDDWKLFRHLHNIKGTRPLFRVISRAADAVPDTRVYAVAGGSGGSFPSQSKSEPDNPPARRQQVVAQGGGFYRTKPNEMIVLYGPKWGCLHMMADTHRVVITFPPGSDIGTVVREAL